MDNVHKIKKLENDQVDIFNGASFNKNGYFNASGGLHSANLWILK